MEKSIINVEGMSCEHCVKAVNGAVSALAGVQNVSVDLDSKTVTVEYDAAQSSLEQIKAEIEDQGYDVV
ncbi:copper chaperone CopZ [Konateibacter massiliensis]|uniref:copper chaperone CopZ n=1 Tax=Konateibacter massiliensis TaxID=2002841 RepID=UPI000C15A688|nr:copper chaperone CopZ [Konateibacter massiliensis]